MAVLMMADSVEAASRSYSEIDEEIINNLVENIINSQKFPYKPFVKSNVTQAGGKVSVESEGNEEVFQQIIALGKSKVGN